MSKSVFATPFVLLLSSFLITTSIDAAAQTPGTAIQESTVSQDIVTLFDRGAQLYPDIFVNGSNWYSYSGFIYKYFANSGIYVGVNGGNVFLMGGPYGASPVSFGAITGVSASLQNSIAAASDFANITAVKTTYDLPRLFEALSMEWTTVSGAVTLVSGLQMTRKGVEQVNGVSTEHIQVIFTASNTSSASTGEMWVDSTGTVRHFILNGFDYGTGATADAVGRSMVSGMLLALAASESTTIKTALTTAAANPAVAQSVSKKSFGGQQRSTLTVSVSAPGYVYSVDLSDMGSFSIATSYEAKTGAIVTSNYRLISLTLR